MFKLFADDALVGFTLIELLVVVAIISILASMLLPVLGSARYRAKCASCIGQWKQTGIGITMYDSDYENIPVGCIPGSVDCNGTGLWGHITECNQTNSATHWCKTTSFGLIHPYTGTMQLAVCPVLDKPNERFPLNEDKHARCTGNPASSYYTAGSCPDGQCNGRYSAYSLHGGNTGGGSVSTYKVLVDSTLDRFVDIARNTTFDNGVNMFSGDGIHSLAASKQRDAGATLVWGSTIMSDALPDAHSGAGRKGVTLLAVDGAVTIRNLPNDYWTRAAIGLSALPDNQIMYRRFEE